MTDLPTMGALSPEALRARKEGLLARVAAMSMRTTKIAEGYRFGIRVRVAGAPRPGPVFATMRHSRRSDAVSLRFCRSWSRSC
jgi:hypothetical protein